MRQQTMSFGASIEFRRNMGVTAERTAMRSSHNSHDVVFQTWPNRQSMAKSIRMQQQRVGKPTDWKALVPLTDTDGF